MLDQCATIDALLVPRPRPRLVVHRRAFTLLDRSFQIIVLVPRLGRFIPRIVVIPLGSPFRFPTVVLSLQAALGNVAQHPLPHRSSALSLHPQPVLVLQQVGNVLGLLTHVGADVLTVVVDIDKLFEGLYDVDVVAEVDDDVFGAGVEDVVQQREGLTVGRSAFAATDKNKHIKRKAYQHLRPPARAHHRPRR